MRRCNGRLVSILVVLFLFSGTSHASHWELNGVLLCRDTADEGFQRVVSDGAGGAIVAWADGRSPAPYNIYAQRIDRYGRPQWSPGGVLVCQADGQQYFPRWCPMAPAERSSRGVIRGTATSTFMRRGSIQGDALTGTRAACRSVSARVTRCFIRSRRTACMERSSAGRTGMRRLTVFSLRGSTGLETFPGTKRG